MSEFDDLIEITARAICTIEFEDPGVYWGDDSIPDAVEKHWRDYIPTAVAALEAINAKYHIILKPLEMKK